MSNYPIKLLSPDDAPVLDVPEVVALEQRIAAQGTSLATLMERAGTSVAQYIQENWKPHCGVVILCGSGNNGGDGWVIGRQLAHAGYPVKLVTICTAEDVKAHPAQEAAAQTMEECAGLDNFQLFITPDSKEAGKWMAAADVVVDALLGTGFAYDSIREPARGYIRELRDIVDSRNCCMGSVPPFVLAVDVPSGLNAQTGTAATPCVKADCTITMIVGKPGIAMPGNHHLVGKLHVAKIADMS